DRVSEPGRVALLHLPAQGGYRLAEGLAVLHHLVQLSGEAQRGTIADLPQRPDERARPREQELLREPVQSEAAVARPGGPARVEENQRLLPGPAPAAQLTRQERLVEDDLRPE